MDAIFFYLIYLRNVMLSEIRCSTSLAYYQDNRCVVCSDSRNGR